MGCAATGQGIADLREEVFRLIDSLAREAPRGDESPAAIDATTKLQSVANLLGQAQHCLDEPQLSVVGGELTAA
jgi:hypothetical protein